MNRLLITGATGFLGMPCVGRAAPEFEVHAAARERRGILRGAHFHPCDLFDDRQVTGLLAKLRPTHLLHLAWIATPGIYWTSPENRLWVDASKHLIGEFQANGGRRAVIAGTCAEYDWTAATFCREYDTPARPATLYGQCKNELREWSETSGPSIAWARLFFLYGPRENPTRLVPSVARALVAGEVAECSEGSQVRDFLHTTDVADALISLLQSTITGPVNVGSGEPVSVRTVIEHVARVCQRPDLVRFGSRPTPQGETACLVADVTRLRRELGWRPRIGLEDGLRDCVNWWRTRRAA